MIEADSKEASEEEILDALLFGQKYVKELCEFQEEIIKVVGKEKTEIVLKEIDKDTEKEVFAYGEKKMLEAVRIKNKIESYEKIAEVKEEIINYMLRNTQVMIKYHLILKS